MFINYLHNKPTIPEHSNLISNIDEELENKIDLFLNDTKAESKILLIFGPVGSGKTLNVAKFFKDKNYKYEYLNISGTQSIDESFIEFIPIKPKFFITIFVVFFLLLSISFTAWIGSCLMHKLYIPVVYRIREFLFATAISFVWYLFYTSRSKFMLSFWSYFCRDKNMTYLIDEIDRSCMSENDIFHFCYYLKSITKNSKIIFIIGYNDKNLKLSSLQDISEKLNSRYIHLSKKEDKNYELIKRRYESLSNGLVLPFESKRLYWLSECSLRDIENTMKQFDDCRKKLGLNRLPTQYTNMAFIGYLLGNIVIHLFDTEPRDTSSIRSFVMNDDIYINLGEGIINRIALNTEAIKEDFDNIIRPKLYAERQSFEVGNIKKAFEVSNGLYLLRSTELMTYLARSIKLNLNDPNFKHALDRGEPLDILDRFQPINNINKTNVIQMFVSDVSKFCVEYRLLNKGELPDLLKIKDVGIDVWKIRTRDLIE